MSNSAGDTTIEKFYQVLFNIQGYRLSRLHLLSDICYHRCHSYTVEHLSGMCTNCRKNHAMSDELLATQARTADSIKKDYVHKQLTKIKERCAVCKSSTCDRIVAACFKNDSRHYCYRCHAHSCDDNYHQNCISQWIDNDGQSCPYCFLVLVTR